MTKLAAAAAIALTLLTATEARADLIYNLSSIFNGETPDSTSPWLTATFHTVSTGTVTLTLTSSLEVTSEFISDFAFNVDPSIVPSSLSFVEGTPVGYTPGPTTVGAGAQDAQNLNGGGAAGKGFDIQLVFDNAPPGVRFDDSDVAVFTITGTGLTAESFDFTNTGSAHVPVAAHINGITTDCPAPELTCSGAAGGVRVPEPASVLLLFAGFAGLMAWRRFRT
jgi:PEP-CTERM motif-containing protein